MTKSLKIGVVGATGMVGKAFMQVLAEKQFPLAELRPFASDASIGKTISLMGKDWTVQGLKEKCFDGLDLVFFSSGDDISKEWAPKAVASGAFAVDNSAAFRMDPKILLVVPEVNGHLVTPGMAPQIIANPNCSTIQLVVALKPLADRFGIETVKVSSYQAVSGAGQAGADELVEQMGSFMKTSGGNVPSVTNNGSGSAATAAKTFPHQILFNCIPQIGSFNDQGFCSEEMKIMGETKKILGLPELKVSAMTVRIPALNSHSESVWVRLKSKASLEQVKSSLSSFEGLIVEDDPKASVYPTALQASGKNPVYVGRIHADLDDPQEMIMWVVADNIRKGAAYNGLQIAELIYNM